MNAKVELIKYESGASVVEPGIQRGHISTGVVLKVRQLLPSAARTVSIDSDDILRDRDWPYRVDLIRSISPHR